MSGLHFFAKLWYGVFEVPADLALSQQSDDFSDAMSQQSDDFWDAKSYASDESFDPSELSCTESYDLDPSDLSSVDPDDFC